MIRKCVTCGEEITEAWRHHCPRGCGPLPRDIEGELAEAEEVLAILEETERFLLEEIGGGGNLTLATTGQWAENLAETREFLAEQRAAVERLRSA